MNGISLGGGYRPSKYWALQVGGQYAQDSGIDFYNGYLEGLAIMPLASDLSVFASLGLAYGKAETSVTLLGVKVTASQTGSGWRAGLGAQYWITPNWGLRATIHRQNVVGVANDIGMGIAYRF